MTVAKIQIVDTISQQFYQCNPRGARNDAKKGNDQPCHKINEIGIQCIQPLGDVILFAITRSLRIDSAGHEKK